MDKSEPHRWSMAEAAGVSLGMDTLTGQAFTAALWCCAVMSAGYLIFVPLVTRGVGKALNRVVIPQEGKNSPGWPGGSARCCR